MEDKFKLVHWVDEDGKEIRGIITITSYLDGFIVLTEYGVYTNVKKLFPHSSKK